MKPRIFISAVTSEFGSTRQLGANVLQRLGYDPVWQNIFGTEQGDLRKMLRDKIDDCEGLVHLVGFAYGAEPTTPDEQFGRVSYTQFELLYAKQRGKKTWILFAEEGFPSDKPRDQLDLPVNEGDSNAAEYQSQRRALQDAWRKRLRGENQLWHSAISPTEVELQLERIKDDFRKLRQSFVTWQRTVTLALVALLAIAIAIWFNLPRERVLGLPQIKIALQKEVEETYQKALKATDSLTDWRQREAAKQDAIAARAKMLEDVDAIEASITKANKAGESSPVFFELMRIVKEQGVKEGLEYVRSQEPLILARAGKVAAEKQRELRTTLQPMLEGARMQATRGDYAAARAMCEKILELDPKWPDAVDRQFWNLHELGNKALRYESIPKAKEFYELAHTHAKQLADVDGREGNGPDGNGQRDLAESYSSLGRLSQYLSDIGRSREHHGSALAIRKQLAELNQTSEDAQRSLAETYGDLGNAAVVAGDLPDAKENLSECVQLLEKLVSNAANNEVELDLAFAYNDLGDVHWQTGELSDARDYHLKALDIVRKQFDANRRDNRLVRCMINTFDSLGSVFRQNGRLQEALKYHREFLRLAGRLQEASPNDNILQRSLSVAQDRMGHLSIQLGRLEDAREFFQQSLDISEKLVLADQTDAYSKRAIVVAYARLGDISLTERATEEATKFYQKGFDQAKALAEADPGNATFQLDLFILFRSLGDASLQANQTLEALEYYRESADISQKLVDAQPTDAQAQRYHWYTLRMIGHAHHQRGASDLAATSLRKALGVVDRLIERRPNFLSRFDVASSKAVRVLLDTLENPQSTESEREERKQRIDVAVNSLKEALEMGFGNVPLVRMHPDFSALRGVPEFDALIDNPPQAKP